MTARRELLDLAGLSEADLVARARRGEREAFRTLMQRCNQRLFRTVRSVVPDDAEAEDVLQETYARAFAGLDGFRGEAALLTWLTRIALNDAGRRRRRRDTVDLEAVETAQAEAGRVVAFPGAATAADPEQEAARTEVRRLLERAVDGLPEPFRLVFILREVEELSIEETAVQLDLKPQTVKTRLHRARRLLRVALDETLSQALTGAFPFLGRRCDRITSAVLDRLARNGVVTD